MASCLLSALSWLRRKQKAEAEKKSSDNLLRDKVTEEEIARIVARWTGIPVAKLMEGESSEAAWPGRHPASACHRSG